jgi:hypothetical protein
MLQQASRPQRNGDSDTEFFCNTSLSFFALSLSTEISWFSQNFDLLPGVKPLKFLMPF